MAKRAKAKRKPKRRIRRAVQKWTTRQVQQWAKTQKARMRKAFGPKVIASSAKRDRWERQFPDVRRKPELVMEKVDEWHAEFTAELDNGWRVPFKIDYYRRQPLDEAAYDAAELQYGPIARTRTIIDMEPCNDLAEEIILEGK